MRRLLPNSLPPPQFRIHHLLAKSSGPAAWPAQPVASSLDSALAEVLRMQLRALLILLAVTALFTAGIWVA